MRTKLTAEYTLEQLANRVEGKLYGDGGLIIRGVASSEEELHDHISFLRVTDPRKIARLIQQVKVGAVLVSASAYNENSCKNVNCIVVPDPLKCFVSLIDVFFSPNTVGTGIHPTAVIDPEATIGKNVSVGPYSVVGPKCRIGDGVVIHSHVALYGRSSIGAGTVIHSHATVREDVTIEANCLIQSGTVIGSDGFGYFFDPAVGLRAVPQVGRVTISEGVEIGANCCIDRATLGVTLVGKNTKLDNLVQVGHNVTIGSNSLLCGQVGVAGSSEIGNGVTLGGQVGVADHVVIADGVRIGGKSAALTDIPEKGDYAGIPAIPASTWRRLHVLQKNLPEVFKTIRERLKM